MGSIQSNLLKVTYLIIEFSKIISELDETIVLYDVRNNIP